MISATREPAAGRPTGEAQIAPGHLPTLIASFLHFDLSFMLWVLLGALGIYIGESLGLDPAAKGLMVATPILSGALLRIPLGFLSDRYGGRWVGAIMLAGLFLPLSLGWLWGSSLPQILAIGLMLGTAGASFAVALPLASAWYPPGRQGLVMGIAAAGNSGTVLANLLAPRLADVVGWHNVLGLAMIPLAVVLIVFLVFARNNPRRSRPLGLSDSLRVLRQRDLWWFCAFYSVTFGGYVGLSSFLPLFLRDQYAVDPITAGYLTALAAFVGSGLRPVGGYLADRFGGVPILTILLGGIAASYLLASQLPALALLTGILVAGMACLGMGNGAIFQLVPQRFRREIGSATGMIGAIGGVGGFLLPTFLGAVRQTSGSYSGGFLFLGGLAVAAIVTLALLVAAPARRQVAWPVAAEG